jgi:hypothetical protein
MDSYLGKLKEPPLSHQKYKKKACLYKKDKLF